MRETDLRDAFKGRGDPTGVTGASHQTSHREYTRSTSSGLVQIGLFAALILVLSAGLSVANESGQTGTPARVPPGVVNAQDPEAYMQKLADRLRSTDSKNMLLAGTNRAQPRAAAANPTAEKPAAAQPGGSASRPTELALPRLQPGAATLTQPLWSRPLATDSSSQEELKLFEPNTPPVATQPAETPSNVIVVRDPDVVTAPETTAAVPETTAAMPETTAAMPETTPAVPETTPTVPETAATVPETVAAVPETAAAMPETTATVPNTQAGLPNAAAAVPDVTVTEPNPSVTRPDGSLPVPDTTAAEPGVNASPSQRPPLDAATWMSIYNKAAEKGLQDIRAERRAKGNRPWTLSADLEKYRAHAVKDGSRESGESLLKALERSGLAVGDGVNVFLLGYASDRAQAFRANDGKSLLDDPGKVPQQAGATIGSAADGLYSLADLITLNALPDPNKPAYRDNVPIVRPIIFAGRTVGGVWKTTEEIGNAVTWGLFDNVTGCIGLLLEDIIEVLKHTGEAVTNVARLPIRALGARDENAEKTMDWVLLVPLELVSNSMEMKGISNTIDYKTAFADKGVIGSIVEFGGSSFILYRAIDEAVDKMKDDHKHHRSSSNNDNNDGGGGNNGGGGNEPIIIPSDDAVIWVGDLWPWWPPE